MKPIEFYKCKDSNVHEIMLRGKRIFGVDLCEEWHISGVTMHGQEGKNCIENGDEITKLNIFLERNKEMNNFTTESIYVDTTDANANGCIRCNKGASGAIYCVCGPVYEDCPYSSIDEAIKKCPNFQPDATVMSQETYNECLKIMEDKKIEELTIKDSGDRTKFETGAVRDMHSGKGRMDLLPWHAIMEVSKHSENGAVKYGEHNVDKGIPVHSLLDSGMRHTAKFITRQEDEPHLVAACWNLLWALEMMLTKPEMDDRYKEIEDAK